MKEPLLVGGRTLLVLSVAAALFMVAPAATQEPGPRFSTWSQAVAVGAPLRTPGVWEGCPFISKDDLSLFFRKEARVPGVGWRFDILVTQRESADDAWGTPVNLGLDVNTAGAHELCSFVTIDGHWLYFVSGRPDDPDGVRSYGGNDIFVAHRKDRDDPTGWGPPVNLGPQVNTSATESGPSLFEDEETGKVVMYFTRTVSGRNRIFQTELLDKVNPGPATLVPGLNVDGASDWHAFIRRKDGLEVIFASNRGGLPNSDLFVATRPTTSSPWSTPVNLGPLVNDPVRQEGRPSISWDGTTLYFWTDREWFKTATGGYWDMHVYTATRTKITGKDK
jgi:hypothetical protein